MFTMTLHHVTELFVQCTIELLNTHNLVHKANKTLVVQISCHNLGVRAGSNNEGSCHCSSAPYRACKSELCTLGAGETASLVALSCDD